MREEEIVGDVITTEMGGGMDGRVRREMGSGAFISSNGWLHCGRWVW